MLASDFKRYVVSTLIAILSVLSLWLMTDDNMGGIKGLNATDVKQKEGNFTTSTVQTDTNQGTLFALGADFPLARKSNNHPFGYPKMPGVHFNNPRGMLLNSRLVPVQNNSLE